MTLFFRLVWHEEKEIALKRSIHDYCNGVSSGDCFDIKSISFSEIPGSPFAYWVSSNVRRAFARLGSLVDSGHQALHGASSKDDFRFLRLWWELGTPEEIRWVPFSKGGSNSPFYMDISTYINWKDDAREIEAAALHKYPYLDNADWILHKEQPYFEPVLYQTLRSNRLALYVTPRGCVFGDNGFQIYSSEDNLFWLLGLLNSGAGNGVFALLLGRAGYAIYRNGTARKFPLPELSKDQKRELSELARRLWSYFRHVDMDRETSHAFIVPRTLLSIARLDQLDIDLEPTVASLNDKSYSAFGFDIVDRTSIEEAAMPSGSDDVDLDPEESDRQERDAATEIFSWALGVAFGRFDWRLATGEREPPPEPEPFDPLPAKSPGMLPDGDPPFHAHPGILVDDPGHPHDLVRIAERVLERVDIPVPGELRRWLQRDFFPFHLQRYSKSRRKAPVYWPLATESGSYTLWLYYPSLTRQTLYTAVNDFVEPKLKQVTDEASQLRARGSSRSRTDEKRLEGLESLETELRDLCDQLLAIAPRYQPNHDDGVQITAAPLWPLFRHKPWQKVLKDTWAKLEKGDYDWAHLAMAYWPDRVREKCKTDKSLAIAHGLEELYVEATQGSSNQ